MQSKKLAANKLKKLLAKAAKKTADMGVNTACSWMTFQPKEPESLKKLRKF